MSKLTVIIPTYNEESYLEDALFSVLFADEIIVIDSFSEDKTPEIAK
jgi:glycosyltransferase involved in cell wall biosynthesis